MPLAARAILRPPGEGGVAARRLGEEPAAVGRRVFDDAGQRFLAENIASYGQVDRWIRIVVCFDDRDLFHTFRQVPGDSTDRLTNVGSRRVEVGTGRKLDSQTPGVFLGSGPNILDA